MPEENLYELLQIEPTADSRSIRLAYRRLMLLHHPDRNAGVDAQEMAQRLNSAYEILRNPERRAAYDWELTGEPGEPPGAVSQRRSGLWPFAQSAWLTGAGAVVAITAIVIIIVVLTGGGEPSNDEQPVQVIAPVATPNITPPISPSPTESAGETTGNSGSDLTPTPTPSASFHFESGEAFIRNGDFNQAINEFTIAIDLIPSYGYGYQVRGDSYFQLAQYQRAIDDYDLAIELDLNDRAAYSGRGRAHFRLRQFQPAIEDFSRALLIDPRFASAYSRRGLAYVELLEFDLAKLDTDRACSLDSQYCAPLLSVVPTATPEPTSTPRPAPETTPVSGGTEFIVIITSVVSMKSDARLRRE
jgi:curved DNA-binding protein CbpA